MRKSQRAAFDKLRLSGGGSTFLLHPLMLSSSKHLRKDRAR